MADFSPPFSDVSGERRYPDNNEQDGGFSCGAADLALFNGMFHRIESEIGNVISAAGLTQSNGNLAQLLAAINALIAAATGGGSTSDYVLMSQARVRLPIHGEIDTADGKIIISSPGAGTVRVPAGVKFRHRGIFEFNTAQTDFTTTASKTYHLRWSSASGFALKDLADSGYNPSTLPESDVSFDSKYDDWLIARVITNAANVASITNLVNLPLLRLSGNTVYSGAPLSRAAAGQVQAIIPTTTLNWSRRPDIYYLHPVIGATATGSTRGIDGHANLINAVDINRYLPTCTASSDFESVPTAVSGFYAQLQWSLGA